MKQSIREYRLLRSAGLVVLGLAGAGFKPVIRRSRPPPPLGHQALGGRLKSERSPTLLWMACTITVLAGAEPRLPDPMVSMLCWSCSCTEDDPRLCRFVPQLRAMGANALDLISFSNGVPCSPLEGGGGLADELDEHRISVCSFNIRFLGICERRLRTMDREERPC